MFEKYERLHGQVEAKPSALTVPRFIQVLQNCVKHQIQDIIIERTHFNDLLLILMRLDILKIKEAIRLEKSMKNKGKKQQNNVRNISAADAIKFLKGG